MSRLSLLVVVALVVCAQACAVAAPAPAGGVGITQPPALYVPKDGKIVTELNISDGDVLGLVKSILGNVSFSDGDQKVETSAVAEAISGVKSVRVIVIQLPKGAAPDKTMAQAEGWVAQAGKFTKIMSDTGFVLGQMAVYAQANNTGYVAYSFDSKKNVLYAARLVGSVDVAKLMDAASGVGSVAQILGGAKAPEQPAAVIPPSGEGK